MMAQEATKGSPVPLQSFGVERAKSKPFVTVTHRGAIVPKCLTCGRRARASASIPANTRSDWLHFRSL